MKRRSEGRETWHRLLEWDKGDTASERLAGHILRSEGYIGVDPSHPLGGKDQKKDLVFKKGDEIWVCCVYFPRGQQTFPTIKRKAKSDFDGAIKNNAKGIAFVTNQEITLSQRKQLDGLIKPIPVDNFHLERIASILDKPESYGLRLEFLDIEMTKEEQVSFFAVVSQGVDTAVRTIAKIDALLSQTQGQQINIPIKELIAFRDVLAQITDIQIYSSRGRFTATSPLEQLNNIQVPVTELINLKNVLSEIVDPRPDYSSGRFTATSRIGKLTSARVEIENLIYTYLPQLQMNLRLVEQDLDRILGKSRQIR